MATLHVRNVPDVLYEWLRIRAEEQGRSIGSEAISILQDACAGNLPRDVPLLRSRFRRTRAAWARPWERFAPEARGAVGAAQREARALGHDYLGGEHVLLALAREGAAARILEHLGVGADEILAQVERRVGRGEGTTGGELPLTPRLKKALELAVREALALGDEHVGPEHVLLGLAAEGEGVAAEILSDLGANAGAIRGHAIIAASRAGSAFVNERREEYRAVALTGSADEWTAALNAAADEGYELVSVIQQDGEPRAVFRRAAE